MRVKILMKLMGRVYLKVWWFSGIFLAIAAGSLYRASAASGDTQEKNRKADFKTLDREEVLPEIEAKTYQVSIQKRSRSLRVYLFQQDKTSDGRSEGLPLVGKILLLTKGNEFVMAFRVLKTYAERAQFAASKVRLYDKYTDLEIGDALDASEKVADLTIPEYTLKDKELDRHDLQELESGMRPVPVPEYDPDLDAGTSPPPKDDPRRVHRRGRNKPSQDDEEDLENIEIKEQELETVAPDEIKPFDPDYHWLSLGMNWIRTPKPDGTSAYYTGAGLRYGLTTGKNVFARSSGGQDSFVWEASLHYYSIVGYETPSDSWTILPIELTFRYNLMFSEAYGMFFYGGVTKNMILSSSTNTQTGIDALSGVGIAAGAGMVFRLGPKWFFRTDLGTDLIGAGLVLRF